MSPSTCPTVARVSEVFDARDEVGLVDLCQIHRIVAANNTGHITFERIKAVCSGLTWPADEYLFGIIRALSISNHYHRLVDTIFCDIGSILYKRIRGELYFTVVDRVSLVHYYVSPFPPAVHTRRFVSPFGPVLDLDDNQPWIDLHEAGPVFVHCEIALKAVVHLRPELKSQVDKLRVKLNRPVPSSNSEKTFTIAPEIIDTILEAFDDPREAYRVANALNRRYVRDNLIKYLPYATMDHASRKGQVDLLDWWKKSGLECKWTSDALDSASEEGHVHVLQWWKDSGFECKWTHYSMDFASKNGHVDILQWWKDSGLECKWTHYTMDWAGGYGHVHVLQWWKDSGLAYKWCFASMDSASFYGHVHVLQWWKDSGLKCKFSANTTTDERALKWWSESGLENYETDDLAVEYSREAWWEIDRQLPSWKIPIMHNSATVMSLMQVRRYESPADRRTD